MIYQAIQQDIDLWEAWIEFDHMDQNFFGTLYIIGEVVVDKKTPRAYIKRVHGGDPRTLVLRLQTASSSSATRVVEVVYSESLKNIDQYDCIRIYRGTELLTQMSEIETLVS